MYTSRLRDVLPQLLGGILDQQVFKWCNDDNRFCVITHYYYLKANSGYTCNGVLQLTEKFYIYIKKNYIITMIATMGH